MDTLIDEIFGDPWISLQCHGGECLHYSQVPGYVSYNSHDLYELWLNEYSGPTSQTQ